MSTGTKVPTEGRVVTEGLVDWLLACPEKGYFVALETESTVLPEATKTRPEVVRERLESGRATGEDTLAPAIGDLVGSIEGLPADLSARKKHSLGATGYGEERRR